MVFLGVVSNMRGESRQKAAVQGFKKLNTIDLRIDYIRPGKGSLFTATGYILRAGRKVAVARMELHNENEQLIAVGTGSYIIEVS